MSEAPPLAYRPRLTPVTQPFYEALADGRLVTTRCRSCSGITFPPKAICPHCWSEEMDFEQIAPTGVLRSFTEVWAAPAPFAGEVPYVLGIVDLDAGVRCAARLTGRFEDHVCDERVELRPQPATPVPLFAFERAGDA